MSGVHGHVRDPRELKEEPSPRFCGPLCSPELFSLRSRLWRSHTPWWTLREGSPPRRWGELVLEAWNNYSITDRNNSVSSHQGLVSVALHVCRRGSPGWCLINRRTRRRLPRSSSQNSARPCGSLETKKNTNQSHVTLINGAVDWHERCSLSLITSLSSSAKLNQALPERILIRRPEIIKNHFILGHNCN